MTDSIEQTAKRIVENEVHYCVSALIYNLTQEVTEGNLAELLAECWAPALDYESAVRESDEVKIRVSHEGTQWVTAADDAPYLARYNMSGCMPDNPPAVFSNEDDAREYLIDQLSESEGLPEDFDAEAFADAGFGFAGDGYFYTIEPCEDSNISDDEYPDVFDNAVEVSDDDEDTWREAADAFDIEPYEREVFEHWIVSDWFARQLAARGERIVEDFHGLIIWCRTTTGQAIMMDSVVEDIARQVNGEVK